MGMVYKTVGLLLNAGKIVGVRLVDIAEPSRDGAVLNLPLTQLGSFIKARYVFSNMYFDSNTKAFVLNSGDLRQLPWYDANTLKVLKRSDGTSGVIVTISAFYKDKKLQGYAVIDGSGKVYLLGEPTYKEWRSKYKFFEEAVVYKLDIDDAEESSFDYAIGPAGDPIDHSKRLTPKKQNSETPTQQSVSGSTTTTQATSQPTAQGTVAEKTSRSKDALRTTLNRRQEAFKQSVKSNTEPVLEDSTSQDVVELKEGDLGMGIPIGDSGIYRANGGTFVIKGVSAEADATIMCKDTVNGSPISVVSRIMRLTAVITAIRPFYGAYFSIMDKIPVSDINTMATDGTRLFYNPVFTATNSEAEILFILLHEIYHGMMLHHVRRGERDPYLFNVACDLFINKTLQEEFNLSTKYSNIPETVKIDGSKGDIKIVLPAGLLFSDQVNTGVDTPERIYAELKDSLENQEQEKQQDNNNNDSSDENANTQQNSGNNSSQSNDSNSEQKGENENKDTSSNNGNATQSESNNNSSQSGNSSSNQQNSSSQSNNSRGLGKYAGKDITFRGKQVSTLPDKNESGSGSGSGADADDSGSGTKLGEGGYTPDIIQKWPAEETNPMRESATRDMIERAVQIVQKQETYSGNSADSIMGRLVAQAQAPLVSWKSALAHIVGHAISDYARTFQKPDRRFVSGGGYYPGKKDIKEGLDNVYFCIDTSGSITDTELGVVFSQIKQLMKMPKFKKLKAKVIFWDTQVCAVENFEGCEGFKQYIKKAKPAGGGGTVVDCVFEYVMNANHIRGTTLSEPYVLVIFTDGCFATPNKKYSLFKDTLWIISNETTGSFKQPWGKMVKVTSFIDT